MLKRKCFISVCFLALTFSFLCKYSYAAPETKIFLGKSKTEITPSLRTALSGYGKRRGKPSQGVHDPLFARSLALTRNGQTFIFVSVDLVLIDEKLRKRVLQKLDEENVREEQLVLFATHTHSGVGNIGGRFWERFIMGKFRENVFEKLTGDIAHVVIKSIEDKIPVEADYGEIDIDDLVENRMDKKLNYPDRLKVLRFKSETGDVAGSLLFMASHPTILPASNFLFSADFPGVLTRILEEQSPGSVALFANGAAADLRPRIPGQFDNRFQGMEAYGQALAQQGSMISFKPIALDEPWRGVIQKVKLPKARIRSGWFRLPSFIGNRYFPRKIDFQAVRLGQQLFLVLPGEVGSEIGWEMEREAAGRDLNLFMIGFANDYMGYVIPRRYYLQRNHYEARVSFYGKKFDWFFREQTQRLTDLLLTEDEKMRLKPEGRLEFREKLPVLKLGGTAYHRGFEEGRLLRKEIQTGVHEIFRYFRKKLPILILNRWIINQLLDRAWKKMEPYVSYDEYQQMKGLAEGAGVSFRKILRLHALPEVYPTWCSNGAFWGKATQGGRMIALRNLDWNREIGIQRFAAIKFYEAPPSPFPLLPRESLPAGQAGVRVRGEKSYVNIGYYGFIGVLSGMNERGISVGQVGAPSEDETVKGVPMPFLLKRILSESGSLQDTMAILERSDRTRVYNYVIADATAKEAVAVESTHRHLAIFRDQDPKERDIPYALSFPNAVFRADPALDSVIRNLQWASKGNPKRPGLEIPAGSAYEIRYRKQGELVQKYYGSMNPEIAEMIAREIAPASNIQSVIYAFPDFWVANAKNGIPAAQTEYIHFNFEELAKDAS